MAEFDAELEVTPDDLWKIVEQSFVNYLSMHPHDRNYHIERHEPEGGLSVPFTVGNKQYTWDLRGDEDEYSWMVSIENENKQQLGSITVTPLTVTTSRVEVYSNGGHDLIRHLTSSILYKVEGEQTPIVVDDYGNERTLLLAGNYRELAQEFTFDVNANDVHKFFIEQGRKARLDFLGTLGLVLVERLDDKETRYSFLLFFVKHGYGGWEYGEPDILLAEITLSQTKAGECGANLYIYPHSVIGESIVIKRMDCTAMILRFWRERIIDAWLTRTETPTQDAESSAGDVDLSKLLDVLNAGFDSSELRTLCFHLEHLEVDYDSLRDEGKQSKARELIKYCERHKCISELVETIVKQRSDISWSDVTR